MHRKMTFWVYRFQNVLLYPENGVFVGFLWVFLYEKVHICPKGTFLMKYDREKSNLLGIKSDFLRKMPNVF